MRILFLEQYGSLGGGQQVLLELAASACALGCTVEALIPGGKVADKLAHGNAIVTLIDECRLRQGKKNICDIFRWIVYSIRVFVHNIRVLQRADLLYVNGARLLLVGALASFFLRKKIVYHLHLHYSAVEYCLFRILLRSSLTLGLVVPSAFIRRHLPMSEPRIFLVENGLDARFSTMTYRDRFTNASFRNAIIVGRLSPEKGQDILTTLAPAFSDMTFHVFGDAAFSDGAYDKKLRRSLPSNVVFHGWVEDVAEKINELQIQLWIVPSRCEEASSLVCMQGVASSCLVAVRTKGALADMANELGLPRFHNDEDMVELLGQLRECGSAQLARTTRDAFHKTMERYSHDEFQKRLADLLQRLLSAAL